MNDINIYLKNLLTKNKIFYLFLFNYKIFFLNILGNLNIFLNLFYI